MHASHSSTLPLTVAVAALLLSSVSCTAMRQNLRGQELSFRGAYFCPEDSCGESDMERSRQNDMEGTTPIQKIEWAGEVSLAFTAEAEMSQVTAKARDCKGNEIDVAKISRPGDHRIGDERARESWMIRLDRKQLNDAGLRIKRSGKCSRVMVQARGEWSDGASYSASAGVVAD